MELRPRSDINLPAVVRAHAAFRQQDTSIPATKLPMTNGLAAAVSESPSVRTALASGSGEQAATIGKSLVIKGEVTGSESLYIDGKVEGSINLLGNRVTIGPNGQVSASITAREVVVQGKVWVTQPPRPPRCP